MHHPPPHTQCKYARVPHDHSLDEEDMGSLPAPDLDHERRNHRSHAVLLQHTPGGCPFDAPQPRVHALAELLRNRGPHDAAHELATHLRSRGGAAPSCCALLVAAPREALSLSSVLLQLEEGAAGWAPGTSLLVQPCPTQRHPSGDGADDAEHVVAAAFVGSGRLPALDAEHILPLSCRSASDPHELGQRVAGALEGGLAACLQVGSKPAAHTVALLALAAARRRLLKRTRHMDMAVLPAADESDGWCSSGGGEGGAPGRPHVEVETGSHQQPRAPRQQPHQPLLLFVVPWPRAKDDL